MEDAAERRRQGYPLGTLHGARAPAGGSRLRPGVGTAALPPRTPQRSQSHSAASGLYFYVRRHLHMEDAVGLGRRLAALELVDQFHALHDFANHGVLAVEE